MERITYKAHNNPTMITKKVIDTEKLWPEKIDKISKAKTVKQIKPPSPKK